MAISHMMPATAKTMKKVGAQFEVIPSGLKDFPFVVVYVEIGGEYRFADGKNLYSTKQAAYRRRKELNKDLKETWEKLVQENFTQDMAPR